MELSKYILNKSCICEKKTKYFSEDSFVSRCAKNSKRVFITEQFMLHAIVEVSEGEFSNLATVFVTHGNISETLVYLYELVCFKILAIKHGQSLQRQK